MEPFPPTSSALSDPNGLLAVGGDLSPERLLAAYKRGIFPWYEEGEPILWWTPEPRAVLYPSAFHLSRSLKKFMKTCSWTVSHNAHFETVIRACAEATEDRPATWISPDMLDAYIKLHTLGYAHSVEVLEGSQLVGGLYGVKLGNVFFGESMFSQRSNASKVALYHLCQRTIFPDLQLIDCQMPNEHLESLGMTLLPRLDFEAELSRHISTHVAP